MKGSKNLLSLGATAALAAAAAVNATPPPPHTVGLISKNPPKHLTDYLFLQQFDKFFYGGFSRLTKFPFLAIH